MLRAVMVTMVALAGLMQAATAATDAGNTAELLRLKGMQVQSLTPVFSQLVVMSAQQGFKTVYEHKHSGSYIRQAVLEGESEKKWTQMITLTGEKDLASKAGLTPQRFIDGFAAAFKHACGDSFDQKLLIAGKLGENEAASAVLSCGASPQALGLASETVLVTAIKGKSDYYTIQWSERGVPSRKPLVIDEAKWEARFKKLLPISLCDVVPGETAPFPSCVDVR